MSSTVVDVTEKKAKDEKEAIRAAINKFIDELWYADRTNSKVTEESLTTSILAQVMKVSSGERDTFIDNVIEGVDMDLHSMPCLYANYTGVMALFESLRTLKSTNILPPATGRAVIDDSASYRRKGNRP